ncbi:hypothetical protein [Loigolactobacillus rennini]|uniref:Uncharacterized protein n=1 Tax=Loigolactobacillus rennini DSM 20253 TaxID=1423796 RepID=A0A0R2CMP0_9LACO|nr:hypothetical protein [Loigolactobacillus rennini]KRM92879.1 hypothetical protein FC24_GL000896 [Loigolactobacillus rennini DSM 20253]
MPIYQFNSIYTLKAPLSHQAVDPNSVVKKLNTVTLRNGDQIEQVFAYSGNALRGGWRDQGAKYLLNHWGHLKLPQKAFNLLFTGGNLSGNQVVDVSRAQAIRHYFPLLSLLGGAIGNQILAGKITQTFAYPVCAETTAIVPPNLDPIDYQAQKLSWRRMTEDKQFIRMDDSKQALSTYLDQTTTAKKAKSELPAQMLYGIEYLIPNTQLWHNLELDCTELELGALVSCLAEWAQAPYLGGMSAQGFGLCDLVMLQETDDDSQTPFLKIVGGKLQLAPLAKQVKDQYDAHLKDIYADTDMAQLIKLLEGKKWQLSL